MANFEQKLGRLRSVLKSPSNLAAFETIGLTERDLIVRAASGVFPDGAFYRYAMAHDLGRSISFVLRGTGAAQETTQAAATVRPTPAPGRIQVTARIGRCTDGQPLVVLQDRPFNGFEVRPHLLERLGENLIAISKLAKQHKGKRDTTVVMA